MAYYNPIHPTIQSGQQSGFSSLGSAVPPFLSAKRKRVPQLLFTPSSKWGASFGRTNQNRPITFDMNGYHGQGIRMNEISARGAPALGSMMFGANDIVFPANVRRITFRICWPGYQHVEWTRSVEVVTSSGPMTRLQLARAITDNYVNYISHTAYATSSDPTWPLSSATFPRLVLVALWNVYEDSWQADVAFDFA
ncbi:hypothetical protein PC9H_004493 [Pleurotus ostreatus]|uniref:Uncharacterized protein n=3 Tax=Pleurotus TaxID=5320 RepID=A0A067NPN1_PLEO1|nr:uncharacterized protein PC9H_004493 [Pleurotus ostreatus]KAF7432552.1 hypothetical protein PC9H_004493 [Pleurotus ostreatus]KAG9218516.1 hypothetical protein CCMSSC00406_0008869 [Pleurotus cornucopiae]KDQ29854.1 hypothetical protein PLEOSDRAFT_1038697 [Pleurotus ostreatus PC15]